MKRTLSFCAATFLWVIACGNDDPPGNTCDADCGDPGASPNVSVGVGRGPSMQDASTDAPATETGPPPPDGCDLAADPRDAPACLSNEIAVFVSSVGNDASDGTREHPYRTLGFAVASRGLRTRVYACAGSYLPVVLTESVQIYGGFSCVDWSPTPSATVVESDSVSALRVTGATVHVEDVTLHGVANTTSHNSIAVRVASGTLTLKRVFLVTEDALPGDDAGPAVAGWAQAPDGSPTGDATPGSCAGTTGGAGGAPQSSGSAGETSVPIPFPGSATGAGGIYNSGGCGAGVAARPGNNAASGDGGQIATQLGAYEAGEWVPSRGQNGARGNAGQGGGGGAGATGNGSARGAGGGAGGCGGAPGNGGGGGGASIGLFAIDSTVTFSAVSAKIGRGGDGGRGGAGQEGQLGGSKGVKGGGTACDGGDGGSGGGGGGGAGGPGGLSVAVLYRGMQPAAAGLGPVTLGAPCAGGSPGSPGAGGNEPFERAGASAAPGQAGVSVQMLAIP